MNAPEKVKSWTLGACMILSILIGCSLFPNDTEYDYYPMRPSGVLSIESGQVRIPISFRLSSAFNSPCEEYSHSDIKQDYHDISVKFCQRSEKGSRCSAVMVDTEIIWGFLPLSTGEYRFHFWQSDSTGLDTTVLIR